ncbi:MAG: uroporphyrinogen decarboxylase [Chloroflexota bacterium]
MNDRFLKACRLAPVDKTPIWMMRQAGRHMAEYRALKEKYNILDIIKRPELAVEVTMQPVNRYNIDAAIIFADILPPLEGMGLDLEFVGGVGPVIHNPIRTAADISALTLPDPRESLPFTLEAIRLVREELEGRIPLIGFAGAPFTLASYAIEGGPSKKYLTVKSLMYREPELWQTLMSKFAHIVGEYLYAQAEAGAQVLQLFDSWVGEMSPVDYIEYVLPYSKQVIQRAKESGVPVIYFGTGTSGLLSLMKEAGSDVMGVDWRINMKDAWRILGDDVALQGNLDPVTLFAPIPILQKRAANIIDQMKDHPGFIFNLGHGILPETSVDHVEALVDFVHDYSGA